MTTDTASPLSDLWSPFRRDLRRVVRAAVGALSQIEGPGTPALFRKAMAAAGERLRQPPAPEDDAPATAEELDNWQGVLRRSLRFKRVPIPRATRLRIIARHGRRCSYCEGVGTAERGPDGRPWHIDHFYPRSRGGLDAEANLVLACATCNVRKKAQLPCHWVPQALERLLALRPDLAVPAAAVSRPTPEGD